MYFSPRAVKVRNLLVSIFNGGITLVILLIAPLGLAAVIVNTFLITAGTYAISSLADQVMMGLQSASEMRLLPPAESRRRSLRGQQSHSSFPIQWWRRR